MKSARCPQCGFVGWADAEFCKRCGTSLTSSSAETHYQPVSDQSYYSSSLNDGDLKKGLAITSLVIGIANFFTLGFLGLGIPVGVILSLMALSKIKKRPSVYGGRPFAVAGLATSLASVVVLIPVGVILAIAIPNFVAARRAANEGSAAYTLRQIFAAEATFQSVHEKYGTLDQLAAERLVNPQLLTGERNGYKFKVELSTSEFSTVGGFEVVGTPVAYPTTGRRSFYTDETGVLRSADSHGADATKQDPPLGANTDYPPSRRTSNIDSGE
jgi:type II secretory pathway pseudopilin PulG